MAYNALNLLKDTYTPSELASPSNIYSTLFANTTKCDLYATAGLLAAWQDRLNALGLLDQVITKYQGSPVVELALYDKFVLYYFEKQDLSSARTISKQLDGRFPGSLGALEAHRVLGDASSAEPAPSLQKNPEQVISDYALAESYPNPFNPSTTLRFALPKDASVRLAVYDILGREVAHLTDGLHQAGYHTVTWNAQNAASGLYFARLTATNELGRVVYSKTNKLLLTR